MFSRVPRVSGLGMQFELYLGHSVFAVHDCSFRLIARTSKAPLTFGNVRQNHPFPVSSSQVPPKSSGVTKVWVDGLFCLALARGGVRRAKTTLRTCRSGGRLARAWARTSATRGHPSDRPPGGPEHRASPGDVIHCRPGSIRGRRPDEHGLPSGRQLIVTEPLGRWGR